MDKKIEKVENKPAFSKKKKLLSGLAVLLVMGLVSAAILTIYASMTVTANVEQSVVLDGVNSVSDNIAETYIGGQTFCFDHELENRASVSAPIELTTSYSPDGVGITTSYFKNVEYSYSKVWTANGDVLVTVEDTGDGWLEWTYVATTPATSGTLKMTVEIDNPTGFGITTFDDGSHDGWYYYNSSETVRISDYDGANKISGYEFVETSFVPDGLRVRIKKTALPNTFMWQGFANFHLASNWIELDDSGSPWVPTASATIVEEFTEMTIPSKTVVPFKSCYEFDIAIATNNYTITTDVEVN